MGEGGPLAVDEESGKYGNIYKRHLIRHSACYHFALMTPFPSAETQTPLSFGHFPSQGKSIKVAVIVNGKEEG